MASKLIRIPASIPLSVIKEAVATHNKTLKEFFSHNQEPTTESFGGECQDLERWVKSTFKNNEVVFTKNGHRCSLEFYKYDYCSVKLSVQGETVKLSKHFDRVGDSHLDVTKTYPLEKLGIAKDDFIKYKSSVEASVFSDRG